MTFLPTLKAQSVYKAVVIGLDWDEEQEDLLVSPTIQEIYSQVIRTLSPPERLRLVTLILNDLVQHDADVIDRSDTWTEQDRLDLVAFSFQYSTTSYPESEDLAE